MQPPDSIRTGTFWYWVSDNISKEGVIADLRAMKKAGIGLALIGNIVPSTHHNANYPYGDVKFMSEEWWDILHTALKTATELDIEIGIFNSPGWSQSGGPWVTPEQSMRYLAATEINVSGPRKITELLPATTNDFQDVKVLAFQASRENMFDYPNSSITVSRNIKKGTDASYELPVNEESYILLTLPEEATARGIMVHSGDFLNTRCMIQVREGNEFITIKEFTAERDVTILTARGFDQKAPVVESLPETAGKEFRLLFYKSEFVLENIPDGKLYIDLGEVSVSAKIKINGQCVGGVWTAPYRVDITDGVRTGKNEIEIEVVNTWINRIFGDRKLLENERKVVPHTAPWSLDAPLQKSGLLGPVRVISIKYFYKECLQNKLPILSFNM